MLILIVNHDNGANTNDKNNDYLESDPNYDYDKDYLSAAGKTTLTICQNIIDLKFTLCDSKNSK